MHTIYMYNYVIYTYQNTIYVSCMCTIQLYIWRAENQSGLYNPKWNVGNCHKNELKSGVYPSGDFLIYWMFPLAWNTLLSSRRVNWWFCGLDHSGSQPFIYTNCQRPIMHAFSVSDTLNKSVDIPDIEKLNFTILYFHSAMSTVFYTLHII